MFYLIIVITSVTAICAVGGYIHVALADKKDRKILTATPFVWMLLPVALTFLTLCVAQSERSIIRGVAADDPAMTQRSMEEVVALDARSSAVLLSSGHHYWFQAEPPRVGSAVEVVCDNGGLCREPSAPAEWLVRKYQVSWWHWVGAITALTVLLAVYGLAVSRPYRRLAVRRLVDHS